MRKRLEEEEELREDNEHTPSNNEERLEAMRNKQVFMLSKRRQTSDKQKYENLISLDVEKLGKGLLIDNEDFVADN